MLEEAVEEPVPTKQVDPVTAKELESNVIEEVEEAEPMQVEEVEQIVIKREPRVSDIIEPVTPLVMMETEYKIERTQYIAKPIPVFAEKV